MSTASFYLADIAHGRSGDKGNHANVAVIAYTPAGFAWLRDHLTADANVRAARGRGGAVRQGRSASSRKRKRAPEGAR